MRQALFGLFPGGAPVDWFGRLSKLPGADFRRPPGVGRSVGSRAFEGCTDLSAVQLPDCLTEIPERRSPAAPASGRLPRRLPSGKSGRGPLPDAPGCGGRSCRNGWKGWKRTSFPAAPGSRVSACPVRSFQSAAGPSGTAPASAASISPRRSAGGGGGLCRLHRP